VKKKSALQTSSHGEQIAKSFATDLLSAWYEIWWSTQNEFGCTDNASMQRGFRGI